MSKDFVFRFEGFQQDAFGGAFPLFTEVEKVVKHGELGSWSSVEYGSTVSGRSLFERGYKVPSFQELQETEPKTILTLERRKIIDIGRNK